MSFDGIVTRSVLYELNNTILGGRIDKIYQPEKDEILLHIHCRGSNYKLLLSSSSNNPRIYLTNSAKKNPDTPPMFCMLLRKYLVGGIILNIEQFLLDRVIFIDISSIDELGQKIEKRLVIEIMGKYSNIILIDKESKKIVDSIKRVSLDISRMRQILPSFIYELPPSGEKQNPLDVTKGEFVDLLNKENRNRSIYKFFYNVFFGLSPLISREICFNSFVDIDRPINSLNLEEIDSLYYNFNEVIIKVKSQCYKPLYITSIDTGELIAFYSLDINQFGNVNKVFRDSISEILNTTYINKDLIDRINQKSQSMKKSIHIKLDRALSKIDKLNEELIDSKDRDKFKIYADLISANFNRIQRGSNYIKLENFYDENMIEIEIPLDIKLSPVDNAQKYYKKYSKLKNAENLLAVQIEETQNEILYLENVLLSIENCSTIVELDEIKNELTIEGFIKLGNKNKKRKVIKESSPHHYQSQDKFHIYVGKNNMQNDSLTFKSSKKDDIWLHVQNLPGSHVVIKTEGQEVPLSTLNEAVLLAAFYSKGKNSNHVPVDYTFRKNVKKPKNAKAGMVIYDNFKTLIVDSNEDNIRKINKVED